MKLYLRIGGLGIDNHGNALAARGGHTNVVKLLLRKGASIEARNNDKYNFLNETVIQIQWVSFIPNFE